MKILIDQAGFVNKGAELMFCSVVEQLERRYPTAQLLIKEQDYIRGGYSYCLDHNIKIMKYGFATKVVSVSHKIQLKLGLMKPSSKRLFVHASDVDVIIDAGGFRFGDQWKIGWTRYKNLKKFYRSFSSKCKIILLPQSFGPFERKYSRKTIDFMLERVDLAYAREEISMQYISALSPKGTDVRFKRDFTIAHKYDTFIKGILPHREYVVVIPNNKMVTHSKLESGAYLETLCEIVGALVARGERIYLLNHEGVNDLRLCRLINEKLKAELPIMNNLSAMEVKNVIGSAKAVISSRFHGVVSGITQQVPTFCTSWSHKYNELLAVYGLSENLIEVGAPQAAIARLEDALQNPQRYITSDEILSQEKESIEQMWSEVFEVIDRK